MAGVPRFIFDRHTQGITIRPYNAGGVKVHPLVPFAASNVVVRRRHAHADRNANGIIINGCRQMFPLGAIRQIIAPMPVSSALFSTMTGTDSVESTAKSMVRHRIACFISRFHR